MWSARLLVRNRGWSKEDVLAEHRGRFADAPQVRILPMWSARLLVRNRGWSKEDVLAETWSENAGPGYFFQSLASYALAYLLVTSAPRSHRFKPTWSENAGPGYFFQSLASYALAYLLVTSAPRSHRSG